MQISEILKNKENLELLIQKFPDLQLDIDQEKFVSHKDCCNSYKISRHEFSGSIYVEFFYLDEKTNLKVYPYDEKHHIIGYGTLESFFCKSSLNILRENFKLSKISDQLIDQILIDIKKRLKNDNQLEAYLIKNRFSYKVLEHGNILIENSKLRLEDLIEIQKISTVNLLISLTNPKHCNFIIEFAEKEPHC